MTGWERFRRARARRNEATHPVELPPPVEDEHAALAARLEAATPDDLLADLEEGYSCEVCGLGDQLGDPVAHFKRSNVVGEYLMAHADCGEAHGLEFA